MGILRFILALAVVIAHSGPIFGFKFVGGLAAVQAFYIISGFYMTLILNEKYIGINGSYKLFISNRFLRLFPIYWTVLFLTLALSVAISVYTNGADLGQFSVYAQYFHTMSFGSFVFLLFTNLFLFLQDIVMFLGLDVTSGHLFFTSNFRETSPQLFQFLFIPQAWTIGVEIAFYLIAPFIVRRKIKFILLLILCSILLRLVLVFNGLHVDPWAYRFFPTELVFFLLGVISYHIYLKIRALDIKKGYLKAIWGSLVAISLFYNFIPIPYKYPIYLVLFLISLPFVFMLTKNWKVDAYIGELSYPIYISHMFLLSCITTFNIPVYFGKGLNLVLVTILFSLILNEFVAKKNEKVRQKRLKQTT